MITPEAARLLNQTGYYLRERARYMETIHFRVLDISLYPLMLELRFEQDRVLALIPEWPLI